MAKHSVKYARFDDGDINSPDMSLDEIADKMGLSKTRCGDIYRSAMKKMRLRMIAAGIDIDIRDFILEKLQGG